MFKIAVILLGTLGINSSNIYLSTDAVWETKVQCEEAISSASIKQDIGSFVKSLKDLGYTKVIVKSMDCITEDTPI